ncbi:MAG: trypsin-like serine protease [Thaumarchaeota archaeon]|nr:trypsin-like serine protease [Nitrososphaerota archaeon]
MKVVVIIGLIITIATGMYYYNIMQDTKEINDTVIQPKVPLIQTNGHSITTQGETVLLKSSETDLSLPVLFKKVENSVVQITIISETLRPDRDKLGSGFVYDQNGNILTNNHVVEDANRIDATFSDGTIYRASVIGTDPYSDLAVIHIDSPKDKLVPLPLGDSSKLQVGDPVAAIGNPFGLSGSMTTGIVSQLGRLLPLSDTRGFSIPDVIQTDAAINPGNSGGPLLNLRGEVIGVNSAIRSATGEFSGIGFAIPSNMVKKIALVLINDGVYKHPWLGVSGRDVTPEVADALGLKEARGFLVIDIVEDSPAARYDIRGSDRDVILDNREVKLGGDVVVGIDDMEVRKIDDILVYLEREKSVGDQLRLTIIRDGEIIEVSIILGERPNILESP